MSMLHLMVGLPGSGKTTLALALARDLPALRLSADDLQLAIFGDDMAHPDHNARHDAIEAALWPLALGALRAGADVILDFGFWSRAERLHLRDLAAAAGFGSVLHLPADPGPAQRLARARQRSGHFTLTAADLAQYDTLFQPPDASELRPRLP
jgi:predicted kinase